MDNDLRLRICHPSHLDHRTGDDVDGLEQKRESDDDDKTKIKRG
jgi:hypothetical protein